MIIPRFGKDIGSCISMLLVGFFTLLSLAVYIGKSVENNIRGSVYPLPPLAVFKLFEFILKNY